MAIRAAVKFLLVGIALQCGAASAGDNAEFGSAGVQVSDGGQMGAYGRLVEKLKEPTFWGFYWRTQDDTPSSEIPFEVRYKISSFLVKVAKENGSGDIPDYKDDVLGITSLARFREYATVAQTNGSLTANDNTCGAAVVFTFPSLLGEFLGKTRPALVASDPTWNDELNVVAATAYRNSSTDEKLLKSLCAGPKYESIILSYFNFLDMLKSDSSRYVADAEKARQNSSYPYTAHITCGMGGQNMNVLACFQKSDLKLTSNNKGKIFKIYNLADAGVIDQQGLHIPLPEHFEISAQNSHSTLILKLSIVDQKGKSVFSDEQGAYGTVRVAN